MTRARLDRDLALIAALGVLAALRFLPDWARGLAPFWGDLTYIHQPWRAFDAELLAAGRLPLWNPYLYLGMPQMATMQDGFFYPGSAPFFVFGFAGAAAIYSALHYWLAGALTFLWLRALGLRRVAAFGAAALLAFGGLMLSREPFLNHLAVLALAPALPLFFRRPALLALALALGFWAGYPPFLVGASMVAWIVSAAVSRPGSAQVRGWLAASIGAAALAGCLLVPAMELFVHSRRSGGMPLAEALGFGFSPRDLMQWLSPLVVGAFNPAVQWWKCCYLGFFGWACAALGARAIAWRGRLALGGAAAATALLILAGSNSVSTWLWTSLPPLRFVRYPGNTAYLALLPLTALAAAGLHASRLRLWLCAGLCLELFAAAVGAMPRAPRSVLSSAGPLVRRLQAESGGHRYLLSPKALESSRGQDVFDWRHRLYGLTNAPFKLRAAGNFGEPLVPRANYEFMNVVYSAPGAADAAAYMPWADVAILLTPQPVSAPGLKAAGRTLWDEQLVLGAAGGRLLAPDAGETLPLEIAAPADRGLPLSVRRPREDQVSTSGVGPGWAFLAEPMFPGWRAWLETSQGPGQARALPALGPFQKFAVPAGPWSLHLRYIPGSFAWGLASTLAALCALGAYWYNRLRTMGFSK